MTFHTYLSQLDLRHFSPDEFLTKTERKYNRAPPKRLWPNIVPTAVILDALREELGRPVIITSCYRAPRYNARIGGASRSQHIAFTACDISSAAGSDAIWEILTAWRRDGAGFPMPAQMKISLSRKQEGEIPWKALWFTGTWPTANDMDSDFLCFAGGLGKYERFVHIDTRGSNATWRGH